MWKDIITENSEWFVADEQQTSNSLNYVYTNYNKVKKNAVDLMKTNREKFTLDKMSEKLATILEKCEDGSLAPKQVKLQLPKLKKVNKGNTSSELPKLKLPKLKKVTQ